MSQAVPAPGRLHAIDETSHAHPLAVLRLRHCLSLGGWVAPLPREPPATIADIAPGTCGVLWDADGAPALLVSHADGGLGCAMAPIAFPAQTTHPKSDRAGLSERGICACLLRSAVRLSLSQPTRTARATGLCCRWTSERCFWGRGVMRAQQRP